MAGNPGYNVLQGTCIQLSLLPIPVPLSHPFSLDAPFPSTTNDTSQFLHKSPNSPQHYHRDPSCAKPRFNVRCSQIARNDVAIGWERGDTEMLGRETHPEQVMQSKTGVGPGSVGKRRLVAVNARYSDAFAHRINGNNGHIYKQITVRWRK